MIKIFGIRDKLANAIIGTLWLMRHEAQAIRTFTDIASDPQSSIAKHPADYELLELGHLTDNNDGIVGILSPGETGRVVLDGATWAATQQPRRAD